MNYFSEKAYDEQDFTTSPLPKGEYEYCIFKNCNFAEADLSKIRFIDAEFLDCDFSNAKVHHTSLQDVRFKDCKLLGIQFDSCDAFNFSVNFEHCLLNHSVFYRMKLNRTSFHDCQLHHVDFAEADLSNSKLTKCDLLNATFDYTNLEQADLRGATQYSIDPEKNRLKGAKFSLLEVVRLLEKYGLVIE
ncbi:MAG: pentapeptide repeat-containing protein [Bacteroidota bacterium]